MLKTWKSLTKTSRTSAFVGRPLRALKKMTATRKGHQMTTMTREEGQAVAVPTERTPATLGEAPRLLRHGRNGGGSWRWRRSVSLQRMLAGLRSS